MPVNLQPGPLIVDIAGTHITAAEKSFLTHPAIGGVILFARNLESRKQATELIAEIKSVRDPSLLIAVDQEGGRVQRFKKEFFILPAANRYGQIYDDNPALSIKLCRAAGCLMASELRSVGVDFSFAPVLDCANLASDAIGDRGFHEQPEIIATLASAFIDGMGNAGMVATGKHFPGHGGVITDSHFSLPVDNRELEQLFQHDLIPYKMLVEKLSGIMTAHVHFPMIDDELPTFSSFWLNKILRNELGFTGMIFSDDLSMAGALVIGDAAHRVKLALTAGCDMALICNDSGSAERMANALGDTWQVDERRFLSMRAKPANSKISVAALQEQLARMTADA
jgi:beta-N-acetylhexosaminidase